MNQKGCLSLQARRPISTFTGIEESIPAGFLSYNALQAKLERRFSAGLYFLNSFTYSRAIDNASGHLDTPNGDNSRVNLANLKARRRIGLRSAVERYLDRGLGPALWPGASLRCQPHRVPMQMALGDWQISATNIATSGQPVNLTYSESGGLRRERSSCLSSECLGKSRDAIIATDEDGNVDFEFPELEIPSAFRQTPASLMEMPAATHCVIIPSMSWISACTRVFDCGAKTRCWIFVARLSTC